MSYRYYSTQRPIAPGTIPTKSQSTITPFDDKTYCEDIKREAWGYVEYIEPLTKEEAEQYELTPGFYKEYFCVTTSVYDDGRVIAAITASEFSERKPENTSMSTSRKDIYNDWFDDIDEAKRFVEEARNA